MSTLADLSVFIVDTEHKTAPTQDHGIPSIRTPNVGRGRLVLDKVNRVSEETFKEWTRRAVPEPGDLIIAREAPVGNVALIQPGQRVCLGQRTVLVRPDAAKVEPAFLCYWLLGREAQAFVHAVSTGATVPHLNMRDIRALPVKVLPPLPTQRRIAAILSAYDDLIEVNTRRIAILEEMARRVYEEWFGKIIDAPNGVGVPLGQVFKFHRGKSYRSAELGQEQDGLPLMNLKNIAAWGGFRRDGTKRFTGDYKAKHLAFPGDILMAVTDMTQERRLVAQAARVPTAAGPEAVFSMDLLKCVPCECDRVFGYALLRWSGCADQLKEHANGANVLHLSPKVIERFEVVLPPIADQKRYSEWATPVLVLIDTLEDQNSNLRAQRDLLLPRLVSGKLSVDDAERQVEEDAA